ncbi:MAG: DUF502 domain-containing protein [Planctomycetota bacterium]
MRRLIKYFLQGSLVLLPVMITVYLGYVIIATLDRLLFSRVGRRVTEALPMLEPTWFTPLVGVLTTLLLVTVVGVLASNFLGRKLVQLVQGVFERLPFVRVLYTSVRDLLGAFVGEQRRFEHPVLVTPFRQSQIKLMGFMTRESLATFGIADHVAVYVPQSYNFAGNLMVVPRELVVPIAADRADVMAFIVSGGVSGYGGEQA